MESLSCSVVQPVLFLLSGEAPKVSVESEAGCPILRVYHSMLSLLTRGQQWGSPFPRPVLQGQLRYLVFPEVRDLVEWIPGPLLRASTGLVPRCGSHGCCILAHCQTHSAHSVGLSRT